jgi:predicted DNA-binding transcriptional regulator YafY
MPSDWVRGCSAKRTQRFKEILRLLRDGPATSRELASRLRVGCKTIQRDLIHMKKHALGVDGKTGGKTWRGTGEGLLLPELPTTAEALESIVVLKGLVTQYEGTPLGRFLQDAFEQFLRLIEKEGLDKAGALERRIAFITAPPAKIRPEIWDAILRGLRGDYVLEIEYRKGGSEEPKTRRFEPYGLIVRNREWFLHGFCEMKKVPLTLFVPYITAARVLEKTGFEVPKDFDLAAFTRGGFWGLHGGGKPRRVVLRFSPDAAGAAESAPFATHQKNEREADDSLRVTFQTDALDLLKREVLRWGEYVEVLEPKELREGVIEAAKGMVAAHRARKGRTVAG